MQAGACQAQKPLGILVDVRDYWLPLGSPLQVMSLLSCSYRDQQTILDVQFESKAQVCALCKPLPQPGTLVLPLRQGP